MEKFIKGLLLEGKSDDEIAIEIMSNDNYKKADVSDVVEAIEKSKKLADVQAGLKKLAEEKAENEAKKKADSEFTKAVKDEVENVFKTINIDPLKKYNQNISKRWSHAEKKFIETDPSQFSDGYKSMNNMLIALSSGDKHSAAKISSEIDSANVNPNIKATVRSDSNSVGGYSIPTEVEGMIQQLSYEQSVVLPLANTNTVQYEGKVYPVIGPVSFADISDQDTAITESNPTFYNPSIAMKRCGMFMRVSNTILREKGSDLTSAFMLAMASARARYIDTRTIIGNIDGAGQSQDGLVWLGVQESNPVAIGSIGLSTLTGMVEGINQEVDWKSVRWVMNQKLYNVIGQLENSGGNKLFPEYVQGGTFRPLGYDIVRNVRITNTLQVGEDNSTGGTDSALLLVDFSKFIIGMEGGLRIDMTDAESFTKDQTTFRAIERMGWNVLHTNSSAPGGICRVQEITGAGA